MKAIRELLADRRRRQRGSVLSAVLIMTAFIAIISGALMTELSTNLLLSRTLVNRVNAQATENSAVELSLSRLQSAQLNAPCPTLATASLNNLSASASYLQCWPTRRESPQAFRSAGAGQAFSQDGVHAQLNGFDDYVVGDSGGNVFDIPFGSSAPRWTLKLGGQVTAPPMVTSTPASGNEVLDVVPLSGPACTPSTYCLDARTDTGSAGAPASVCVQPTSAVVATQPAASPSTAGLAYYGYGTTLESTDFSSPEGTTCDFEFSATIPGGLQVTGGVMAFRCVSGCGSAGDQVYAVVGSSSGSEVLHYTQSLSPSGTAVTMPWPNATGLALSGQTLPASAVVTFAGGELALVQISSKGSMTLAATSSIGAGIAGAPYWCHCPGGDQIGVGGQDGVLYVFNSALQQVGASPSVGTAIDTTPGTDAAGNWYAGARDGFVHEVQLSGGTATLVDGFGRMGAVEGGVQVGGCGTDICIYAASSDGNVYLVPLDARRAIISACITSAPPTCSGANPRLWASLEVGDAGSPQAVHVEGWSYYSG